MAKFVNVYVEKWMTPRDREILVSVYRHGMLNTKQIEYLHFRENKYSKVISLRRVRKIFLGGYLNQQWIGKTQFGNMQHFTITNKGAMIVASCLGLDYDEIRMFAKKDYKNIEHSVLIGDFHIGLLKSGMTVSNYTADIHNRVRFKYKSDLITLEPDGKGELFSSHRDRNFQFFMEMERGGLAHDEVIKKLLKYEKYKLSNAFKNEFENFPIVIVATATAGRAHKLKTLLEKHKKTDVNFLFTTIDGMKENKFFITGHSDPIIL